MIVDAWPEPLLAAAHPDRDRWGPRLAVSVAHVDPVEFCALARREAVLPIVADAIAGCMEASEKLRTVIAAARRAERLEQERVVAGLVAAVGRLNEAGVVYVVCKGPVLGVIAVGDAFGRAYRDADVLVAARDLARARELAGADADVVEGLPGVEERGFEAVLQDAVAVDVGAAVIAASRADHLRLAAARVGGPRAAKLGRVLDVARLLDGYVFDEALLGEPTVARAVGVAREACGGSAAIPDRESR